MDKQTQKLMFSSRRQDWATPQNVFDELNQEFNFTLDPCCTERTAKCKKFYTPEIDGLKQNWEGESVFVNPPFGREQDAWIKKGFEESRKPNTLVVFLIPARTDTRAFHKYLYQKAEIRFICGRLKFINPDSDTPKEKWTAAPFPSMVCILGRNISPNFRTKSSNEDFPNGEHNISLKDNSNELSQISSNDETSLNPNIQSNFQTASSS